MNTNTPNYNIYPQTYQQPYQPAVRNITMPFVNGQNGALAYPGPLNATSYYMDSNSMTIYEKTLDGLGQVTAFNIYDLTKRELAVQEESQNEGPEYVEKGEIQEIVAAAVADALKNQPRQKHNNSGSKQRPKEDKNEVQNTV